MVNLDDGIQALPALLLRDTKEAEAEKRQVGNWGLMKEKIA